MGEASIAFDTRPRGGAWHVSVLVLYVGVVQSAWLLRGSFDWWMLGILTACAAALPFALARLPGRDASPLARLVALELAAVCVAQFFLWQPPTLVETHPVGWGLLAGVVSLGALVAACALPPGRARRWLSAVAVVAFGAMLGRQILRTPRPLIDVWWIQTEAPAALLAGQNPYTLTYTDVMALVGREGFGYPIIYIYLPGLLLQLLPCVALGLDIRWLNALAMAGTMALLLAMQAAARPEGDRGARPGPVLPGLGAAVLAVFAFHGGQPHVLTQAWAESLILFYLLAAVAAWHRSPVLTGLALVLALSLKQTTWFCVPFLAAVAVRERRWRLMAWVLAGVAAVTAPFFFWAPGAFFHNVVVDLLVKPPRPDALSWGAVATQHAPGLLPVCTLLSVAAYAGAFACLVRRLRRVSGREALAEAVKWCAVGLLGFFVFLKQAFLNYYYVVEGLLAAYILLALAPASAPGASSEPDSAPTGPGPNAR